MQDAGVIVGAVREQIRKLDKALPIAQVRTMDEVVNASVSQRRFHLSLLIAFGVLASLLATLGVYGVVSYVVSQRTKELGLRVILGAAPLMIQWIVLRQGLIPVCQGLFAGLTISFVAARLLKTYLFQVSSLDPAVISSTIGLVMLASLFACWLPARRAQRLDPLEVLRVD